MGRFAWSGKSSRPKLLMVMVTGRFAWSGNSSRPKLLMVMVKPGPFSALSSVQLFYNQKKASSTTPTVHTHAHTRASLCQQGKQVVKCPSISARA